MEKNMKKNYKIILLTLSLVMLVSCASTPKKKKIKPLEIIKTDFGTIEKYELKNGIPVFYKKNTANRVNNVTICMNGGLRHLTKETSGLEYAVVDCMAKSSHLYDANTRQEYFNQTNATINTLSTASASFISLNVLDKYFSTMFPIFMDGFLHPNFATLFLNTQMEKMQKEIAERELNPESLLFDIATQVLYKDHIFEITTYPTRTSIQNLTYENMMAHVPLLQKAQDLSVFIVGNIDIDYFLNILNLEINLGGLTADGEPLGPLEVPFVPLDKLNVFMKNTRMPGTAVIARAFYVPNVQDYSEQLKADLTSSIFSKILYNVVREKYGACYTPMSYILGGYSNVGLEVLFSVSDFENFADYMEEARQIMQKGLYIQSINPDGSFELVPLQNKLQGFKNSYINSSFVDQKTTQGIALNIANNYLLSNDFSNSHLIETLKKITVEDIITTFEKYWLQEEDMWVSMGGDKEIEIIQSVLQQ